MMIVYASLGVAIVCFILYALDRRSKSEPIAWEQAAKLSSLGGIITGGVVFATTATDLTLTIGNSSSCIESLQLSSSRYFLLNRDRLSR